MLVKNIVASVVPSFLGVLLSLALNRYTVLLTSHWHLSLLYFCVTSFLFNLWYAYQASKTTFVQAMLVGIVIKLLLALILILIYSIICKQDFFNFSLHFISYYILFTIFEIRYLLHLIKINPLHTHED